MSNAKYTGCTHSHQDQRGIGLYIVMEIWDKKIESKAAKTEQAHSKALRNDSGITPESYIIMASIAA